MSCQPFAVTRNAATHACLSWQNLRCQRAGVSSTIRIKDLPEGRQTPVIILTSAGHDTGYRFSTQSNEEKQWIKAASMAAASNPVNQPAQPALFSAVH